MTIKDENHRFVVIIEKEIFDRFKKIANSEKRSASNLAAKIITEYTEKSTL